MSGSDLTGALDALAPHTVVLGVAEPALLTEVAAWAARQRRVMLVRRGGDWGPGTLLVTADPAATAEAAAPGARSCTPRASSSRSLTGWVSTPLDGAALVAPDGPVPAPTAPSVAPAPSTPPPGWR